MALTGVRDFLSFSPPRVADAVGVNWWDVFRGPHVPMIGGFVYVAIVLDAWSRRVVGYAISRSIDARLTLAALGVAVADRKPLSGCVHHSCLGLQGGFKRSSQRVLFGLISGARPELRPVFFHQGADRRAA